MMILIIWYEQVESEALKETHFHIKLLFVHEVRNNKHRYIELVRTYDLISQNPKLGIFESHIFFGLPMLCQNGIVLTFSFVFLLIVLFLKHFLVLQE